MKNNRYNRFIYNLGFDYMGTSKWGWFVIPNFLWNSGLANKFPNLYRMVKKII